MSVGSTGGNMNKSVGLHSIGLTTLDYDLPLPCKAKIISSLVRVCGPLEAPGSHSP